MLKLWQYRIVLPLTHVAAFWITLGALRTQSISCIILSIGALVIWIIILEKYLKPPAKKRGRKADD